MHEQVIVDVSDYPRLNPGRQAPIWWGILGLILVEGSVIAGFIATYLYLFLMSPEWPPESAGIPDIMRPTLSLVLLLVSCVTMWWSGKAITANKNRQFVAAIFISVALASIVLILRWQQFYLLDFSWNEHAYGSIFWTISGFHFIHVVSAVIGTAVVGILGIIGYFTPQRQIGVIVDTLYWNFVAVAWLPFYIVLYWLPRWF